MGLLKVGTRYSTIVPYLVINETKGLSSTLWRLSIAVVHDLHPVLFFSFNEYALVQASLWIWSTATQNLLVQRLKVDKVETCNMVET